MGPTIREALRGATRRVARIGSDVPDQEAREILRAALGIGRRQFLLLEYSRPLVPEEIERLEALLVRRERHEPLQYLLTTVPFCEIELEVGPGVLIPRPETEVLVERLTHWLTRGVVQDEDPWLVDVGTGTGALLLALLHRFPGWRGLGIDRSAAALSYAKRNLERAVAVAPSQSGTRAFLVQGDLLEPMAPSARQRIGLIVSNPPYIPSHEIAGLAPEVREFEPQIALDGGVDGLSFFRRIAERAAEVLKPGGILAFELALGQPERVEPDLVGLGFEVSELYTDLTGRTRGVIARRL